MARPTVPGRSSQSCEPTSVNTPRLGRAPVLDEHRAPPLDHLRLDPGRDRGRAVQDDPQRVPAEGGAHVVVETEQADEHGRHQVGGPDGPLVDEPQRVRGVEPGHHHQLGPGVEIAEREPERRGVVQRSGHEVRPAAVEPHRRARRPPGRRAGRPPWWRRCAPRPSADRWCPTCTASTDRRGRRGRTARRGRRPAGRRDRGRPRPPRRRAPRRQRPRPRRTGARSRAGAPPSPARRSAPRLP